MNSVSSVTIHLTSVDGSDTRQAGTTVKQATDDVPSNQQLFVVFFSVNSSVNYNQRSSSRSS